MWRLHVSLLGLGPTVSLLTTKQTGRFMFQAGGQHVVITSVVWSLVTVSGRDEVMVSLT